jgi:hypothetical protein
MNGDSQGSRSDKSAWDYLQRVSTILICTYSERSVERRRQGCNEIKQTSRNMTLKGCGAQATWAETLGKGKIRSLFRYACSAMQEISSSRLIHAGAIQNKTVLW